MKPERIQMTRKKGQHWKPTDGITIICDRRGPFGNPFLTAQDFRRWHQGENLPAACRAPQFIGMYDFELAIVRQWQRDHLEQLAEADYAACWCPADSPDCHVAVLLELLAQPAPPASRREGVAR